MKKQYVTVHGEHVSELLANQAFNAMKDEFKSNDLVSYLDGKLVNNYRAADRLLQKWKRMGFIEYYNGHWVIK